MKIIKLLTLVLFLGCGFVLHAQHDGPRDHRAIFEDLDLSDEQKEKMRSIHKELKAEINRIEEQSISQKEKMKAIEKARALSKIQVLDILSEEQAVQLKARKEERMRQGSGGMYKILESLDLSDEQRESLREHHKEQMEKRGGRQGVRDRLRERRDMSQQERDAMRAEHEKMREEHERKLKEILTQEQFEKYEKAHQEMMEQRKKHMEERKRLRKHRKMESKERRRIHER